MLDSNQIIETLNLTIRVLTAQLDAATAQLDTATAQLDTITTQLAEANEKNDKLLKANMDAMNKITELLEQVSDLNNQIKQLQEKQNLNPKNSSVPPSSEGLKKKSVNKNRSLRKPSDKKPGGQVGHQGITYSAAQKPDKVVKHMPAACEGCPHREECLSRATVVETRTEVDVVIKTEVTAHEVVAVKDCMKTHTQCTGEFPEDIRANMQFGVNLQSLVVAFNTLGAVSINRIHEILGNVFSIPLSTGTISNMITKASAKVKPALNLIRKKLLASEVTHSDETGFRAEGSTKWAHSFSTDTLTYISLSRFRGKKGMDEIGLLSAYKGINVHDCWASYWKYEDVTHAICNAHILRELNFVTDNYPEQTWNGKFRDLLLEMKSVKEKIQSKGGTRISKYYEKKFNTAYAQIIKLAYEENPLPVKDSEQPNKRGRKKKGKVLSLIERLDTYKAEVCRFVMDFRVPFDNNQAERDIRCIKVKTKVSGCFRTVAGAVEYLNIISYISTARKMGFNGFEAINRALNNDACYIFS